jgi:hypothetical protein
MSNETENPKLNPHGDYERRDIGASGVIYFLIGLAVACFLIYFVVKGLYWYLDRRYEAEQPSMSPLLASSPKDTRRIPAKYDGDYEKYLKEGFPAPQLEVNESTELNDERLREENTLSTYDWVDKSAGTVRIPIDRAMDIVAQRGLPVRSQATASEGTTPSMPSSQSGKPQPDNQPDKKKGSKK